MCINSVFLSVNSPALLYPLPTSAAAALAATATQQQQQQQCKCKCGSCAAAAQKQCCGSAAGVQICSLLATGKLIGQRERRCFTSLRFAAVTPCTARPRARAPCKSYHGAPSFAHCKELRCSAHHTAVNEEPCDISFSEAKHGDLARVHAVRL